MTLKLKKYDIVCEVHSYLFIRRVAPQLMYLSLYTFILMTGLFFSVFEISAT